VKSSLVEVATLSSITRVGPGAHTYRQVPRKSSPRER
jgi:hypothetical protein